jgi:hypothetical protein
MNLKRTKVLNIYAGPGTGKSTTAAAIFAELKYRGVNCEYVPEDPKWATWEGRSEKYFADQVGIMSRQLFKMNILRDEVDLIIMDCPIVMCLTYMQIDDPMTALHTLTAQAYKTFENMDIFLERDPERGYNQKGRSQTPEEAIAKDTQIHGIMKTYLPFYNRLMFSRDTPQQIIDLMVGRNWHMTIPNLTNV